MSRITIYLFMFFILFSCNDKKHEFVEYDFQIDGFSWDADPYKFPSIIRDSTLKNKGSQSAAWAFSYIGDIKSMHKMWDSNSKPRPLPTEEQQEVFHQYEQKSALKCILDSAQNHQVVIINEGHHLPQHRVFTTQLLDGLRKQGFTHLGLETYFASAKNDSILQVNGYPTLTTGYYTKEPQFGNLVRQGHQKGFNLFGYESQGHENGKEREINQAKNIASYLTKHPDEKVLIHCGFDHGYEGNLSSSWEKAMAGRLTEYTGIDPLTINQVLYSERSKREFENPYYQLTNVNEPSVFVNDDGEIFGEYRSGSWFDIAVFHPRSGQDDRPDWMIYDNRSEVDFSFEESDIACPCLVFAYNEGEEIGHAVPYDIQHTDDKKAKLILDKSNYDIIILNPEGKALKTFIKN